MPSRTQLDGTVLAVVAVIAWCCVLLVAGRVAVRVTVHFCWLLMVVVVVLVAVLLFVAVVVVGFLLLLVGCADVLWC